MKITIVNELEIITPIKNECREYNFYGMTARGEIYEKDDLGYWIKSQLLGMEPDFKGSPYIKLDHEDGYKHDDHSSIATLIANTLEKSILEANEMEKILFAHAIPLSYKEKVSQ